MIRPVSRLSLRIEIQQDVVTVHLGGSLEYGVTETLVSSVTEQLDLAREGGRGVRQLRIDMAELTFVDSMGLAALLTVRRCADAQGVALRLDHRPVCLDRLLELTGTLDHLTAPRTGDASSRYSSRPR